MIPVYTESNNESLIAQLTVLVQEYTRMLEYAQGLPGLLKQLRIGASAADKSDTYYTTSELLERLDVQVTATELKAIDLTMATIYQNQALAHPMERRYNDLGACGKMVYIFPVSQFPVLLNILECLGAR